MAYYAKMRDQQEQFLSNRAAPSAVLQTDLNLEANQVQALRDRWNEQAKGLHAGGVPILTHGLKVMPWTQPAAAKDLQLAELTQADGRAYRTGLSCPATNSWAWLRSLGIH
jgi:hypothetical protein